MKVACIQLNTNEDYNRNFLQTVKLINLALKNNSDLVITPETTSIISDNMNKIKKNTFKMVNDPLIQRCKKLSKKFKKWILIGSLIVKDKKNFKNRSILIGPNGNIIKYYDKINMFDVKLPNGEIHKESKIYKPGKKLVKIELPWGKLGFSICFDLRFPELYRKLSKNNLSFIAIPSAFTKTTGKKHWLPLLKARAIENFCYVFAPNQTGNNTKKKHTFGHTVIISPDGDILKLKKSGVGIIYARINTSLPKKLKNIIPTPFKV
jgi:predicted amidohydrolase